MSVKNKEQGYYYPQSKSKASLMQDMNLAGQKYFQVPYNVPSTFGNFYVGSPTEIISDFVPLPLDFIQEDMSNMQNQFDATSLLSATEPNKWKQLIPAAPFNEPTRKRLIQEYGLDTKAREWAKQIAANPLAAEKIAKDILSAKEQFISDPRVQRTKEEHARWIEKIQNQPYQTGWSNFFDPANKTFKDLDPVTQPADFTVDEHMTYWKNNYEPKLVAKIDEVLRRDGTGTNTYENISLEDPRIERVIDGLAYEMMNDPHGQTSRIMGEVKGFGKDINKWKEFVTNMVAEQFYHKNTIDYKAPETTTTTSSGMFGMGAENPTAANIVLNPLSTSSALTVFSADLMAQNIESGKEELRKQASSFGQYVAQALTVPEIKQSLEEAFTGKGYGGKDRFSNFKQSVSKNPNLSKALKGKSASDLLSIYFNSNEEQLTEQYGLTKSQYEALEADVTAGLFEYASGGDAPNQDFVDSLWTALSAKENLKTRVEENERVLKSVESQALALSKKDPEMVSLANKVPKRLKELIEEHGINKVTDKLQHYKLSGNNSFNNYYYADEGDIVSKQLAEMGLLKKDYDANGRIIYRQGSFETDVNSQKYLSALNSKRRTYIEDGKISVDRNKVEVVGPGEVTKNYSLYNLGEGRQNVTPEEVLSALQNDAIINEGGKNPYSNVDLESIIKTMNPDIDFDKIKPIRQIIIDNPIHGKPRVGYVIDDGINSITLEAGMSPSTKTDAVQMALELLNEREPADRAVGARWLPQVAMDDVTNTKVKMFFTNTVNLNAGLEIPFQVGTNTYTMTTRKASDGSIKKELYKGSGENKTLILDRGKDFRGKSIQTNDIKDFNTAFELIGYDLYSGGQGGSSSNVGKPQLGAKK